MAEITDSQLPHFIDFCSYLDYMTADDINIHKNPHNNGRQHRPDLALGPIARLRYKRRQRDCGAARPRCNRYDFGNQTGGAFVGCSFRGEKSDDGSEIRAALGLPVMRLEHLCCIASFEDAYLFDAAGNRAEAISLCTVIRHMRRSSVSLTAVHGEVIWAADQYSLARPRRVVGDYDCPIARRIARKVGGVPRTPFARGKMATATEFLLLRCRWNRGCGANCLHSSATIASSPDCCYRVNKRAAQDHAILARCRVSQDTDALV